jgi:uncharacterized membrane protein YfcA
MVLMGAMTFVAAGIRGVTGFGMAIVLVPLLALVVRPDEAVVVAILLQFLIGPVGLKTILADSERPSSLIIAGSAMLATPLGLWLLARISPDLARILIAGVAIGAFLLVLIPKRGIRPLHLVHTIATGLGAGILTGFAGMPGPPVVPYYLRHGVSPHQARASMMLVFFATAIAGTVAAFVSGLATGKLVMVAFTLLPPMLAGNWLGARAFGKMDPVIWRIGVSILLGGAALSAIWRAAT